MASYVVIFDCDGADESPMREAIKTYGDWAEITPRAYLISAEGKPGEVMERLRGLIPPSGSLWVGTASAPWAGYIDPIVEDVCHQTLGPEDAWDDSPWLAT